MAHVPLRGEPGLDSALIIPTQYDRDDGNAPSDDQHIIVQNLVADKQPTVIRREDGFEKRILQRCQRCNVVIGYRLDQTQFKDSNVQSDDVLYVIPGAITATETMMEGDL